MNYRLVVHTGVDGVPECITREDDWRLYKLDTHSNPTAPYYIWINLLTGEVFVPDGQAFTVGEEWHLITDQEIAQHKLTMPYMEVEFNPKK